MKKSLFSVFIIFLSLFMIPGFINTADASDRRTVRDIKNELARHQADYNANQRQQNMTQSEINQSQRNIINARNEIHTNKEAIEAAKILIEETNLEIARKQEQIQATIKSHQLSNSGNINLEFIFEAESYADLVFRYAVAEQIGAYNSALIDEFNELIRQNEERQIELAAREIELNQLITRMNQEIIRLGNRASELEEGATTIQEDIDATNELLAVLNSLGCGDNEVAEDCMSANNSRVFMRPLNSGSITSLYGYRTNPVTGAANSFHTGMDIAGNSEGTPIYAVANGTVSRIVRKSSCGGNVVYVTHVVNGVKYTSESMHMLEIKVQLGQTVKATDIIGTVGGGRGTSAWERCSTGAHLHISIAKGWYGIDYTLRSTFVSNLINPQTPLGLPGRGGRFSERIIG